MSTASKILAVVLCLIVLAGGVLLCSLSSPKTLDPVTLPPEPILTERPEPAEIPVVSLPPEETPEPQPVEETPAPQPVEETPEPVEQPVETPAPQPVETPEPTEEPALDDAFFDDAAFIGDSVSGVLEYTAMNGDALGDAEFFVAVDYSVHATIDRSMYVYYRGRALTPPDALKECGAKKVFIMLGALGDLPYYSLSDVMTNWEKLVDAIRDKNPDIRIFIQSCTPVAYDVPKINNQMIDEYNARLKEFADQNGCTYVEIGAHFKDASGKLPFEHCRDGYSTLRIDSAKLWVDYLKDPANYSVSPRGAESVSSQAVKAQSFSAEGLTITLTNEFRQIEADGFAAAFDAPDAGLFALKERFADVAGAEALSLNEYIDLVIEANGIQGAEKSNVDGVPCFSYTFANPQDGASYRYVCFAYKTGDAFWLLEFVTLEQDAEAYGPRIIGWAKTVHFE